MLWLLGAGAVIAAGYGALIARAGWAYGHPPAASAEQHDALLDRFLPDYDIVERHQIRIEAPPQFVYAAARDMDLRKSWLARAIFDTRSVVMGGARAIQPPRGLLAEMLTLGWGVLTEVPDRELIAGAICRPWEANVHFQPLAPDVFPSFAEPGYVKIAWTLRAEPQTDGSTLFLTETRAIGTDAVARRRFRRYWSFVSPGVALIRWLSLRPLKKEAERRAGAGGAGGAGGDQTLRARRIGGNTGFA